MHWGGKGLKDEAWESLLRDEFEPRLARMKRDAIGKGWLQPGVRYGYFPANRDGNDLVVFGGADQDELVARGVPPATRSDLMKRSATGDASRQERRLLRATLSRH